MHVRRLSCRDGAPEALPSIVERMVEVVAETAKAFVERGGV
jgi:hypothetical protein